MMVHQWPIHPAAQLFPLLTGGELTDLADDIATNGLNEPVWLFDDPELGLSLLDGRNRVTACEMVGVSITTRRYAGDDPIGFVISENVKRRHLTTGQLAAIAHDALPLFEAQAKQRQGQRTDIRADLPKSPPTRARDHAAVLTGTSGRAVAQFKRLAEQAPDLAEKVRGPEAMPIDRAERIIRDREAEHRRIEQARREAGALPEKPTVDIRQGDFREVLADLNDIDAIVTDPPYPAEYLPLLCDLAMWADKVLNDDGALIVLIGQSHLPEVFRALNGYRPYRWAGCYLTPGNGYVSHPRRVQSNWKPLLVYGGGPRFSDVIRSEGIDAAAKSNHKWGQDYEAFHTIIERFTQRGQTIADPFMGSGTTLLAGHALGRHVIGADIDPAAVATTRRRLA